MPTTTHVAAAADTAALAAATAPTTTHVAAAAHTFLKGLEPLSTFDSALALRRGSRVAEHVADVECCARRAAMLVCLWKFVRGVGEPVPIKTTSKSVWSNTTRENGSVTSVSPRRRLRS